jgi:hypothetical protein
MQQHKTDSWHRNFDNKVIEMAEKVYYPHGRLWEQMPLDQKEDLIKICIVYYPKSIRCRGCQSSSMHHLGKNPDKCPMLRNRGKSIRNLIQQHKYPVTGTPNTRTVDKQWYTSITTARGRILEAYSELQNKNQSTHSVVPSYTTQQDSKKRKLSSNENSYKYEKSMKSHNKKKKTNTNRDNCSLTDSLEVPDSPPLPEIPFIFPLEVPDTP